VRRIKLRWSGCLGGWLAASLVLGLALGPMGGCSDDDTAGDNNANANDNANSNDNTNTNANDNSNTNGCTEGATRCTDSLLETCTAGSWADPTDCVATDQVCRPDASTGLARCDDLAWVQLPVEIDDPIMVGTSLNTPIDTVSFAYDPVTDVFATSFGRDINDPDLTHLWLVDGADGTHAKQGLTGDVFGQTDGFCMGTEDWCQYVGYDETNGEWVVFGPSTTSVMRVGNTWTATLESVSGTHPPDNWISHSHRFAWSARRLFLYGATGPSGFSDTAFAFDLDTNTWTSVATGLPQMDDNCLAYDSHNAKLLSIGGRVTTDGGNTTQTVDTILTIDTATGTHTTETLPTAMGPRRAMSCGYDAQRHLLYVYAGSVVNDRWNEAVNDYHNDLWALDLTQMTWTQLIPDTESGTLADPDQYGDQSFIGHPEGANFGQNRGQLLVDPSHDRLMIIGAVPIFTHEQLYLLRLEGLDQLL